MTNDAVNDLDRLHTLIMQPEDGVAPLLDMLGQAHRTLAMKIYTLTEPSVIDALLAARLRGCVVRVLLNPQRADGTRDNDATFTTLEQGGIAVRWTGPQFSATHEKSVVIDNEIGLIASFNFAAKYFVDTRDHGIITRDPAQLRQILACFDCDWDLVPFVPTENVGLLWAPGFARLGLAGLIDQAEKTIAIQNPKMVDLIILQRLVLALKRGVKLRILCAGRHGLHTTDRPATYSSLIILHSLGARIHALKHPKMHAKMVMIDHHKVAVGSWNLHHRAFDERRELGIVIEDPEIIRRIDAQFTEDWHGSHRFDVPDPLIDDAQDPADRSVWCS